MNNELFKGVTGTNVLGQTPSMSKKAKSIASKSFSIKDGEGGFSGGSYNWLIRPGGLFTIQQLKSLTALKINIKGSINTAVNDPTFRVVCNYRRDSGSTSFETDEEIYYRYVNRSTAGECRAVNADTGWIIIPANVDNGASTLFRVEMNLSPTGVECEGVKSYSGTILYDVNQL